MTRTSRWPRAFLTIAIVALYLVLARNQHLPWIDAARLHRTDRTNPTELVGIFDVGYTPIMFGFIVVELGCFLQSTWTRLRMGGREERAQLMPATMIVAFLLSLASSWRLASTLPYQPFGIFSPEMLELATIASLVAGSFLYLALASLISRHGLGNGFMVLIVASMGWQVARYILKELETLPVAPGWILFGPAVLALIAGAIHDPRVRRKLTKSALRLPTAGYWPIERVVACWLGLLGFASMWGVPRATIQALWPASAFGMAVEFAVALAAAWALTLFFQIVDRPPRTPPPPRIDLLRGALLSGGLIMVPYALLLLVSREADFRLFVPAYLLYVVAALLDLREEWHARKNDPMLVEAWPVHRLALIDPMLDALRDNGITGVARAARYRALLQILGPHVPVTILTPADSVERAREILAAYLVAPDASTAR